MIGTMLKLVRRLAMPGLLLLAEVAVVVIAIGATTAPIAAQDRGGFFNFPFTNNRPQRRPQPYQNPYQPQNPYQQYQQPQPQPQQYQWQWWPQQQPHQRREPREQPVDASKAPPSRKQDTTPTAHITVLGDSLAEQAHSRSPPGNSRWLSVSIALACARSESQP